MALPNEHQLKFNTYKSAKTLMEAIEKRGDGLEVTDGNADNKSKEFLKKTGRNQGVNGTDTIGFDKTKVECYNCHRRGHFSRECRAPKNQDSRNREPTRRTMPAEEGPTNFALMAYTSSGAYKAGLESVEARLDVYKNNEAIFEEDIKILKLDVMLRDNALTELRKKFEKAEKERDDLKLTLEKFENSSKNQSKLLESQVSDKFKTGVGVSCCSPPYTGNFMPSKSDLVLADEDEYLFSESVTSVPAVATSEVKTSESKPKSVSEPFIEDWISDSENENETESKSRQRKPSNAKVEFVKFKEHVKSPRESAKKVENNKQAKYPRKTVKVLEFTTNKNSNFKEKVNTVRENVTTVRPKAVVSDNKGKEANAVKASACWIQVCNGLGPQESLILLLLVQGNRQLELQEKGVIDSGCSRHMTENKSYLSDYEEINGGFVAFGGNSKGGKITGKVKSGQEN
ncbi:ribonuclease H-like domain-containing protein [Tanacetum coccineum]